MMARPISSLRRRRISEMAEDFSPASQERMARAVLYPQRRRRAGGECHGARTAAGSSTDDLRASDAEREAVVIRLRDHAVAGRLDIWELEERVSLALVARTRSELAVLERDLPDAPRAEASPDAAARRVRARRWLLRSTRRGRASNLRTSRRFARDVRFERHQAPMSQVFTVMVVIWLVAVGADATKFYVVPMFFMLGGFVAAAVVHRLERTGRDVSPLEALRLLAHWGCFAAGASALVTPLMTIL